jgi:hypothetical protein
MKRNILVFMVMVFWVLGLVPIKALAQTETVLDRVSVNLWPEYDRPSVLIFYDISLTSETELPAELTISIPEASGGPFAVASYQPDGELVYIPYETTNKDNQWIEVNFTTTSLDSRLEFYDPSLVKNGISRKYVYTWPGDYPVNQFLINVQQPIDAENLQTNPNLGQGSLNNDGMTYYGADVGSLSNGQTYQLELSYDKTTETLSEDSLPVEPVAPIDSRSASSNILTSALWWLLIILGIGLLVGGGIWYWRTGHRPQIPQIRRRHKSSSNLEKVESEENPEIYCHQCGKRAMQGDRYCRVCGIQLRV